MLLDFFTKDLKGAIFAKFRDVIMGWKHVDTLLWDHPKPMSVLETWLILGQTRKKMSPTWRQEEK